MSKGFSPHPGEWNAPPESIKHYNPPKDYTKALKNKKNIARWAKIRPAPPVERLNGETDAEA